MSTHHASGPRMQRGMFLIEALIAILIFSIGILAIVAIQARSVSIQSDAEYRIEAANLVDKMVGQIWLNVDRSSLSTLQTSLLSFQHQPGATANCAYTGTPSANAFVTNWVNVMTSGGTGLPGATTAMQQILVDTSATAYNRVTVTVCWQGPNDPVPHRHSVTTQIN